MKIRSLISAGGIVAIGMIAGRLLGLLRELSIAAYFGVNEQADAAVLLLIVPDFITAVFIGSAASAALIPAFAMREKPQALALFWQMILTSTAIFSVIAIFILLYARFGNWFSIVDYSALIFTFASLPIMGATAVCAAWLQYMGRFTIPAFATVIFNLTILFTLWLTTGNIKILAIGIFTASLLRLFAHGIAFTRSVDKLFVNIKSNWEIDGKLITTYIQTALTGVLGMLPLYAPYFIITASIGGISLFNYAFKLVLLPAILLQTIIQTVILPLFVNQHNSDNLSTSTKTNSLSLYIGYILGVSISFATMLAAQPIATLCFGHGKMSPENVHDIAKLLEIGIWATPFAILSCLWQQMLYAGHKAKTAMMASFTEAALLLPIYWFGQSIWGHEGIMAGYLIIRVIHLAIIIKLGKRHIAFSSFITSKDYIISTLAMLTVFALSAFLYINFLATSDISDIIKIIFAIIIGCASLATGFFASKFKGRQ